MDNFIGPLIIQYKIPTTFKSCVCNIKPSFYDCNMWETCGVHGLHDSACLDGKIISNMFVCLNKMEHCAIRYDKHHMHV